LEAEAMSKLDMRILWNYLQMYGSQGKVEIYRALYKHFAENKNDRGIGIITSCFFKEDVAKAQTEEDLKVFLDFAEEEVL
jgi:hypothetical protein